MKEAPEASCVSDVTPEKKITRSPAEPLGSGQTVTSMSAPEVAGDSDTPAVIEDELDEFFSGNLPSVEPEKRRGFLDGMRVYHRQFKEHRDKDMNYEKDDNYLNAWITVTKIDHEDYWVYSPHFKKVIGLVIGKLFGTRIQYISMPDPVSTDFDTMIIDKYFNNWTISILKDVDVPGKLCVCMQFPRSNIQVEQAIFTNKNDASNPNLKNVLRVANTNRWYEP